MEMDDAAAANAEEQLHCEFCTFATNLERILTRHKKVHHPQHHSINLGDYIACNRCKGFVTLPNLRGHEEICGKVPVFPCKFCDKKWRTVNLVKIHMRSAHANITDEELEVIFDELDETAKVYAFIEGEAENFLNSQGVQVVTIDENVRLQNKVLLYCPKCEENQQRILTTNNPVRCIRCNEPFQYECALCGKRYTRHGTARDHVNQKCAPSQEFKCPHCGKIWYTKSKYQKHLKYHEQKVAEDAQGPKACQNCGVTFATKMGLKVHMWNCKPLGITAGTPTTANWTEHPTHMMAKRRRLEYSADQSAGDAGTSSAGNQLNYKS